MIIMAKAKPFIKWVGGKTQLIEQLDALLPSNFGNLENVTYIEPFIGGGAMLFYMLQQYPNIRHAVINDVNPDLTTCYQTIKDNPEELIVSLQNIQNAYNALPSEEARKDFFLSVRNRYNEKNLDSIENTTKFFFLNRTCFNGLYRVNKKGQFNVPMGAYKNPTICDENNLHNVSEALQNVTIVCGDYSLSKDFIDKDTFVYLDPPYRPISETAGFTAYNADCFDDNEQIRLARFIDEINLSGAKIMLSNSDPQNVNPEDTFFEDLYKAYTINKVDATRAINSKGDSRGKIKELLICN